LGAGAAVANTSFKIGGSEGCFATMAGIGCGAVRTVGLGSGAGAVSLIGGNFANVATGGFGRRIVRRFMGGIGIGAINCTLVVRVGATIDCTVKPAARIAMQRDTWIARLMTSDRGDLVCADGS
jgi:hypothetical protein